MTILGPSVSVWELGCFLRITINLRTLTSSRCFFISIWSVGTQCAED